MTLVFRNLYAFGRAVQLPPDQPYRMLLPLPLLWMILMATAKKTTLNEKLFELLHPVFPRLESVQVLGDPIVQASAVGYRCRLTSSSSEDDTTTPATAFVKHVDAAKYAVTKNDWNDLRRSLVYTRTECRFYDSVNDTAILSCMPIVYHAAYKLDGLIAEYERVTDPSTRTDMPTVEECQGKGGLLVLELIDTEHQFYQASPLTLEQCKCCLQAIAKLHKSAWQDSNKLEKYSSELSIPSFSLKSRNPKEIQNIEASWEHFRTAFRRELDEACLWERTATLATRLKTQATYVSDALSPQPNQRYATLVHGDYKAMNTFLSVTRPNEDAKLVDFASCGIGNPMMDVAMHIHHAVLPDDLRSLTESGRTGEMELLEHYLECLDEEYPKDEALFHYKLAVVDYLRFFMGRMWRSASPETMLSKVNNPNINNINRYPSAAMAFIETAEAYLTEIEASRR